jgi:LAS superfamily LD-carboxypeptidase LdcB
MAKAAAREGIALAPASAYRDFATQCGIWNEKWLGERTLLDRRGRPVEGLKLSERARVAAILVWSAAPGASRHHWGTDLDVYDRAAVPRGYRVRLVPEEYAPGGPFARLNGWLAKNAWKFGFYRPYRKDRGGVSPEPWHLSHAPTAALYSRRLRPATLRKAIESAEIEGKRALLRALPQLYVRYVRNVEAPPRRISRRARAP